MFLAFIVETGKLRHIGIYVALKERKKKEDNHRANQLQREGLNENLLGASHQLKRFSSTRRGSPFLPELQNAAQSWAEHRVQPLHLLVRWVESWTGRQWAPGQGHTDGQDRQES